MTTTREMHRSMLAGTELNPSFDAARFDRQLKRFTPAEHLYVIVFTPRSGSTWLAQVLTETGRHGWPQEYIKDSRLHELSRVLNARDKASLLEMLARKRKTPNGVFGIKVTSTHLHTFGEREFFDFVGPSASVFLLWRRNIVAQGISLFRAVETRRFHSSHDTAARPPDYDEIKIGQWIEHVLQIENENCLILARHPHVPTIVSYEELAGGRESAIALFDSVLPETAARTPSDPEADLTKIGDAWNEEVETRFRADNADFAAAVEARRLILALGPAASDEAKRHES